MIRTIEILQFIVLPFTAISLIALIIIGGGIAMRHSKNEAFNILINHKIGKPSLIIAVTGFAAIFALNYLKNSLVRSEIINFVSQQNLKVKINGQLDSNFKPSELQSLQSEDQRNIGNDKIEILLISTAETYPLTLVRSFDNKNIYWIYSSKHYSTVKNCIGKLNTKLLDKY